MLGTCKRITWPTVSSDLWRHMHGVFLLFLLLGTTIAAGAPVPGVAQEGPREVSVSVAVQNRTGFDAHIFALQGAHMVPLGLVPSMENATLSLPTTLTESGQSIQLVADLMGTSAWHKSDPVNVGPSAEVQFTIESDLERSVVNVTG